MLIKRHGKLKCSFDESWGVQIKQAKTMGFTNWRILWGKLAQEIGSFYPKILLYVIVRRIGNYDSET